MLLKTKPTDIGKKLGPEAHWMLIKWSHLKSTYGLLTTIEVLISWVIELVTQVAQSLEKDPKLWLPSVHVVDLDWGS